MTRALLGTEGAADLQRAHDLIAGIIRRCVLYGSDNVDVRDALELIGNVIGEEE